MQRNHRYNSFGDWLTEWAGCKVQKISVNAGFTCPNRDGTVGWGGCTYCNNQTFNPEYCQNGKSVSQQLEEGKAFFGKKYPEMKYLAYFQTYTNTYGGLDELRRKYEEALAVDKVIGIVIGTRPDCVSQPLLNYFGHLNFQCRLLIEYGIESTNDDVLKHINRGHDFQTTRSMVELTAERGIDTGGHVILGLPFTHQIDGYLEHEAQNISSLPLTTLKIHQLQIIKNTRMEEEFQKFPERFHRFTVDEYIDIVIDFIEHSRPDLVFERFVSQSPPSLLAVPGWGLKNFEFTAKLDKRMDQRDAFQGSKYKK